MGSKVSGRLAHDACVKTRPMQFSDLGVGDFFQFTRDLDDDFPVAWLCVKTSGDRYRTLLRVTGLGMVTAKEMGTGMATKTVTVVRHDVEFVLSGSVSEVPLDKEGGGA
jgi:hypothetical protein